MAIIVNYIWLDVRLAFSHVKSLVGMAVVYGACNYYQTKISGKPVYHFLTWEDYTSFVIYLGLVIGFVGVYYGLSKLSFWLKPGK